MYYKSLLSWILLILFVLFFGKTYYPAINFVWIKFVEHNLTGPKGRHVFKYYLIQLVGVFMTCVHTNF